MLKYLAAASLAAIIGAVAPGASAQDYPNRPIRLVVPFPPGGGADLSGRVAAEELSRRLEQNVIVENKPGAGTQIGIDLVAKSRPDGYTFGWTTSDGVSLLPAVKPTVPYRVPDDLTFVAGTASFSLVLAVNPNLPIKTLGDLASYGKANPGKLRYASTGTGGGGHLAGALIGKTLEIEMVHVPYAGGAPAVAAVVGGHVDMLLAAAAAIKPFADAGTLRVVATTGKARHPIFPDVPTMAEQGQTGLIVVFYMGMIAPAGVPQPALARVRKEMSEALGDPKFVERINATGSQGGFVSGDDYQKALVDDLHRWRDVAKAFNITITD